MDKIGKSKIVQELCKRFGIRAVEILPAESNITVLQSVSRMHRPSQINYYDYSEKEVAHNHVYAWRVY